MIRALLEVLGDTGTLLFPNLNIPHEFSAAAPPRFDLQRDSVRATIGVLPQVFKTEFASEFSRHPTHAMSGVGSACASLFDGHEVGGYPCGPGSPWWRLGEQGGGILLLGATQQNNTSIHGQEELLTEYQLSTELVAGVVVDDGVEIVVHSRLHRWGNDSDFSRINPSLESAGGLSIGRVGHAEALLIDAGIFQDQVGARLRENPRFLLVD